MLRHAIPSCTFCALLLLAVGCRQKQKEYPYLVKATGSELPNEQLIKLKLPPSFRQVDSAYVKDHHLIIRGTITQPGVYEISYFDKAANGWRHINLYLPADSVQVTITPTADRKRTFYQLYQHYKLGSYLAYATVFSTSPRQNELNRYYYLNDSLWNKFFVDKSLLTAKLVQTYDSGNRALVEQWSDSARKLETRFPDYMAQSAVLFVRQHPPSDLTAYALLENSGQAQSREALRPYHRALPDSVKQGYYGQLLTEKFRENKE